LQGTFISQKITQIIVRWTIRVAGRQILSVPPPGIRQMLTLSIMMPFLCGQLLDALFGGFDHFRVLIVFNDPLQ